MEFRITRVARKLGIVQFVQRVIILVKSIEYGNMVKLFTGLWIFCHAINHNYESWIKTLPLNTGRIMTKTTIKTLQEWSKTCRINCKVCLKKIHSQFHIFMINVIVYFLTFFYGMTLTSDHDCNCHPKEQCKTIHDCNKLRRSFQIAVWTDLRQNVFWQSSINNFTGFLN